MEANMTGSHTGFFRGRPTLRKKASQPTAPSGQHKALVGIRDITAMVTD